MYLSDPKVIDVLEAFLFGDIVDDEYGMCPLIVGACDGPEAFLAGGVPDLQFDYFSLDCRGPVSIKGYLKRKSTPMVAR
jgi:hypothetical protein